MRTCAVQLHSAPKVMPAFTTKAPHTRAHTRTHACTYVHTYAHMCSRAAHTRVTHGRRSDTDRPGPEALSSTLQASRYHVPKFQNEPQLINEHYPGPFKMRHGNSDPRLNTCLHTRPACTEAPTYLHTCLRTRIHTRLLAHRVRPAWCNNTTQRFAA